MSSDLFIDKLVGDLTPRNVMTLRRLTFYGVVCFAVTLALLMATMGLRFDFRDAILTGSLFWKPTLFMLSSISCLLWLATATLPGRSLKKAYFLPILLAGSYLSYLLIEMILHFDANEIKAAMTDKRAPYCLGVVTIFGGVILAVLWRVWLKRSAPENAGRAGLVAGLCAGFIAASAYAFHCGQDHPLYLVVYYGLPIAFLSALGACLGKKHLRW